MTAQRRTTAYALCIAKYAPMLAGSLFGMAPCAMAQSAAEDETKVEKARPALEASWYTNRQARALRLRIPAPRGLITDRHGKPLAQNKVVRQMAINFPFLHNASDADILAYARRQFASANAAVGMQWNLDDATILNHYANRRWLPLPFSPYLSDEQIEKLTPLVSEQLFLHASYQRVYPQGTVASHIVGYVGKVGWFPTGPASNGDPLWEESEGRAGLELSMEKDLKGKEGMLSALFAADGSKITWDAEIKPTSGNTIVTTIDVTLQQRAETILAQNTKRGAFVVIDVRTGEILVMASWPNYNPNIWVPNISQENLDLLTKDKSKPLLCRAFQSTYPPASVFKLPVALAGLDSKIIEEETYLSGPPSLAVGNRVFNNWSKDHEGDINVKKALARSTNTWFYQIALRMGGDPLLKVSNALGFGQKTGIPLGSEAAGFVPDHAWAKKNIGTDRLVGGSLANFAIGQGALSTTPLQVARALAGIGNGSELPPARLVRQIQDVRNNVLPTPALPGVPLPYASHDLEIIRQGMSDVVNAGYGTGKAAKIKAADLGGKTGTGQWIVAKNQYVAWFAGLVPIDKPRYAFAILYEGAPGEKVSGGRNSAPLAKEFFDPLISAEVKAEKELLDSAKTEAVQLAMQEAEKAAKERATAESLTGNSDEETREAVDQVIRTIKPKVVEPPPAAPPPEPKKGFFQRLFGNGKR